MHDVFLLLGNQLFPTRHLRPHRDAHVVMVEDQSLLGRLPFHQQKLAFLLASMRSHRDRLYRAGFRVHYWSVEREAPLEQAVATVADMYDSKRLLVFELDDVGIRARVEALAAAQGLERVELPSPGFLTKTARLDRFFARPGKPQMGAFYQRQRHGLKLLVQDGRPMGGRWSFDRDNRKRLPASIPVPELPSLTPSVQAREAIALVQERYPDNPGDAAGLWLPTTRAQALRWLARFIEDRLVGFGTYEDALSSRTRAAFHSVLSPLLNVGLVTPEEVIERAMRRAEDADVPLNDLEGFIRQVIGWREFVRGVYRRHGAAMRERNVWNGQRALTPSWDDAATGIAPLDEALVRTRDHAWNHHIERLMVIANLMNLCEIHPQEVYRFFMTRYVDAYDWVMVPNVFGMGLTSEGGVFATKPYICGSNYLRNMGDHKPGPWCDVVDGLYWRFVQRNRVLLAGNPRLPNLLSTLDRLQPERKRRIFCAAEHFLATHTLECAA